MNKKMKDTIIMIWVLLISNFAYSQSIPDKDLILNEILKQEKKEKYYTHINNDRTIDYLFSGIFFIYKTLISSQDGTTCSFHPSCSEYSVTSIKEFGILQGVLKTSDRLLRCNGFSPEKYDLIIEENLLYDPSL